MIIEFIQSYIWCRKNAPQRRTGHAKEKANPKVGNIWLLLWYRNFDITPIFENDANNNTIQIPNSLKTSPGEINNLLTEQTANRQIAL